MRGHLEFVQKISKHVVPPWQKLFSHVYRSALFTSTLIADAIVAVKEKLELYDTLAEHTPLKICRILELLMFCLNTTHIVYKGQYYKQIQGAAMGYSLSPITTNLYMDRFETGVLTTAPHPSAAGYCYVDDTFVLIHKYEEFTAHANSFYHSTGMLATMICCHMNLP